MPRALWAFSDPAAREADISSSPAVVGSRVYVGSAQASVFDSSGMVYAIDGSTGKPVWQYRTEKQVFSSPAVADGRVYVGEGLHTDSGSKIYCFDAARGSVLWSVKTKSHTESSPAVVGGRVYMGAGDDGVYCLDAARGTVIWHVGGMHVDASPAVTDGKVFLGTGYGRLQAMALDAATGKTVWSVPSPLAVWGPPSVSGGRVFFGAGNGDFVKSAPVPKGAVWCLEAKTGKQVWRRDLPDAVVTAVLSRGDRVCAGSRDGNLYALDASHGTVAWEAPCGGPVVASPATDGTRVYAAGGGKLHALNLTDGKPVWSFDVSTVTAGGFVNLFSSPAVVDGKVYFGTGKEKLLCLGK
jgi:outer membrane protein assembly factor BamB